MRVAQLHFADGHTEETTIPDARVAHIRRKDRHFYKTDTGQDGVLTFREGSDGSDAESPKKTGRMENDVTEDDGAFGPSGDDTSGW